MRFLGIDLGWHGKPSGLAVWDGKRSVTLNRLSGSEAILDWVDREAGAEPAMIAVDAPLVISNAAGMREADRLTHVHFGRFHAGCYPANRGLAFAERVTAFSESLALRGFRHADRITSKKAGRYQIEVYPHAAAVNLFGLSRILKYKKGRVGDRIVEMNRYRDLLSQRMAVALPQIPAGGSALKLVEDQLDAAMCAYIGWHWWTYGAARAMVLGNRRDGYIVNPAQAS